VTGAALENSTVTNASNQAQRVLLRNFRVDVLDGYGNSCRVAEHSEWRLSCRVEGSGGAVPGVEEANEAGEAEAERKANGFVVRSLTVREDSDCPSGTYHLVFTLVTGGGGADFSLRCPFEYASREQYSSERVGVERELRQLLDQQAAYGALRDRIKALQRRRREEADATSAAVRAAVDDLAQLRTLHANRLSQLDHMQARQTAPRAATKRGNTETVAVAVAQSGSRGMVVDLGFVNDLCEARILSFHAARYMDAWVVDSDEQAAQLFSKGVKAWAVNLIKPFRMRTRDSRLR